MGTSSNVAHLTQVHSYSQWNSQIFFFECFGLFRPKVDFLALFAGTRGPPCENIDRDLHFAPVVGPFWPFQEILKNWDLEISKFSNIDEVDRIYMASPRGLSEGKTEPPDYILMFYSANVPAIPYKIHFGDFCPPFLEEKCLRVPPSSVLTLEWNKGASPSASMRFPCLILFLSASDPKKISKKLL